MSWIRQRCRKCGYLCVLDICGMLMPLCSTPSKQHDWEKLDETTDREKAHEWRFYDITREAGIDL